MEEGGYYSVATAAEELGLTPGRVRQMLRSGELEGIPPEESGERGWKIPRRAVEDRRPDPDRPRPEEKTKGPDQDDPRQELIDELRDRVRSLEEANRENRRIIAALTSRIPELEAPATGSLEPRESAETVFEATEREEPRPTGGGPQETTSRPWWRRMFGG